MESRQLTNDAGFKFELWRKLLTDTLSHTSHHHAETATASVAAAVFRVAVPIIQGRLPRRVQEPCCIARACATPSIPYLHRSVHIGRRRIELAERSKDELCYCLAHSTACAGPVVDLVVHGYYATGSDTRDRYRGLRCLLRHTHARCIEFHNVGNSHDAREVSGELGYLVRSAKYGGSPLSELRLVDCALSSNSFNTLAAFLRCYDCLTHVSLENSHVGSLACIAEYVRASSCLQHLSLRNTPMATHWAAVGEAVAASPSVLSLDTSSCKWLDTPQLSEFVASLLAFVPRVRFTLNLSHNLLTSKCFALLIAASASFRSSVTEVCLGGQRFASDDEDVSRFFAAYAALESLSMAHATMSTGIAQRVLRALTDKKKEWCLIDVAHVDLPSGSFKRLCQTAYSLHGTPSLICAGVDLHGQVTKATMAGCVSILTALDLSRCNLTAECVSQLASALERGAPLSLQRLSLSCCSAAEKSRGKSNDGGFPFLCKALRSHCAPRLASLDLSENRLPLLSVDALVEQVSATLQCINLSLTSIAEVPADRARVLKTLMRRQRGGVAVFPLLDVHMASPAVEPWTGLRELTEWIATQTSVRLIMEVPRVGATAASLSS